MKFFISALTDASHKDMVGTRPLFTLQLLSVSIVNEAGESITLLNDEFNPSQISESSLASFIEEGKYLGEGWATDTLTSKANDMQDLGGMSSYRMRKKIKEFIGAGGYLYYYETQEDIVGLKSTKLSLEGFFVRDLKQYGDEVSEMINDDFGINEDSAYPIPDELTTTLSKALWLKDLYLFIEDFKKRNNLK